MTRHEETPNPSLQSAETEPVVGRVAIRAAVAALPPDFGSGDPVVEPVAHVMCRMGGHIPTLNNEEPGSCMFHRRQAALSLVLAGVISPPGSQGGA